MKVAETLEILGMDFSDFKKYEAQKNCKYRSKITATFL